MSDRAPGEVDAVTRVLEAADLHLHTRMDSIPVQGPPAQEIAEDILAALDALGSEQGARPPEDV